MTGRKRNTIKLNIARLRDQMAALNTKKTMDIEQLSKLEAMLADYKQLKSEFELETNNAIDALDENADDFNTKAGNLIRDLKDASDIAFQNEAVIKTFQKKLSMDEQRKSLIPPVQDLNASFRATSSTQPKLEKIAVPTFDGNILNFCNFQGLFENLVHNNEELSNVQKLYYLKQALIGDAKDFVRDFKLDDRSYSEAWAHLLARFDNKRAVVKALFRNLYNLEPIKFESQIAGLLDKTEVILRGLKAAGETVDNTFSKFVTFIVASKLDSRTAKDWENSITSTDSYPMFAALQKFLRIRSFNAEDRIADNANASRSVAKVTAKPTVEKKSLLTSSQTSSPSKIKCIACQGNHFLNQCKDFITKSVNDRFEFVKKHKLCIKCFNPFHTISDCKRPNCRSCNGNHHSLLHREISSSVVATQPTNQITSASPEDATTAVTKSSLCAVSSNRKVVFLSPAVAKLKSFASTCLVRVLFDPASETTLIRREICNVAKLPLTKNTNPTCLVGINEDTSTLNSLTKFVLQSRYNNFSIAIEAEVIRKIPYVISRDNINNVIDNFPKLKFGESNDLPHSDVDIVLGSEYVEFILEDQRQFYEGICLRNSKFGYIISGSQKCSFLSSKVTTFCGLTSTVNVDDQLKRFFEIEDYASTSHSDEMSIEHKVIESHFVSTYERLENGRFQLRLPTRPNILNLTGSCFKAKSMLIKSEQRRSNVTRDAYNDFMFKYQELNHMRKLSNSEFLTNSYYIPHHIVSKETSSTTKFRVVFNASAIDDSGTSLNDNLLTGPCLQPELFDTIVKFRSHRVAFCADIEMMYRQILIHPKDRKYQRIVWRFNPSDPISHCELNTVTYGTTPASYLATKCLQILANSIENLNPKAANVINSNFYMDDLMTGADTVAEALQLQKVIHQTLLAGKFPLRKYQSNSLEFLNHLDSSLIETLTERLLGSESFVFVLGLMWCPEPDCFKVAIKLNSLTSPITKRKFLSDISRIFDVVGMLSPVTIRAKILMQDLWREGLGWNDSISPDLEKEFLTYRSQLESLSNFSIPRCYSLLDNVNTRQLVGFCDASPKAYCAVIYIRAANNSNNVTTSFVCAKTRVAPIKALTIPRLELQAAVVLAQLLNRIANNLNIDNSNIFAFSDSQIVLSWLNFNVNKLKQFVSNRTGKILKLVPKTQWFYVATTENPADLATRGLSAQQFLQNKLWSNGPLWLNNDFNSHISTPFNLSEDVPETEEIKVTLNTQLTSTLCSTILNKFSNFNRCVNILAYINRFCNNLGKNPRIAGTLTSIERTRAFNLLIHSSQLEYFSKEFATLSCKGQIDKCSKLFSLNIFLDTNNIIRVGGRLSASEFSFDVKFPIILHRKCHLLEMYILHIHKLYFHASRSFLVNFIRSKFWVVGGLVPLVKKVIYQCVHCTRLNAKMAQQFMGNLPIERTTITRPFATTGVDLSGFFEVKCTNHRSTRYNKVYIVFFVCFVTRAVHIELAVDLSTEAFIMTLERFVARRGLPNVIYSDNATNFLGTFNVFNQSKLEEFASSKFITWKFIAPRSPHQGGLWESAVKAGKKCLTKAIGNQILNINEFSTLLCRIEAILNSRPIAYKSTNSLTEPLTPGHFLIGGSLLELPIVDETIDIKPFRRYKLLRSIIASFWQTWRLDYLNQLNTREKWQTPLPNFKINDVVILKSPQPSPLEWPLGVITAVHPDPEGHVRVVDVKTKSGTYRRAVQNLVRLPIN